MGMTIEVYDEKNTRNQRFNDLRSAGVKHINRYSSIRQLQHPEDGRTIWRSCWNICYPTTVDSRTTVPHFEQLAAENTPETAVVAQAGSIANVSEGFDKLLEEIKPDAPSDEAAIEQAISEGSPVVSAGANEVGAVA